MFAESAYEGIVCLLGTNLRIILAENPAMRSHRFPADERQATTGVEGVRDSTLTFLMMALVTFFINKEAVSSPATPFSINRTGQERVSRTARWRSDNSPSLATNASVLFSCGVTPAEVLNRQPPAVKADVALSAGTVRSTKSSSWTLGQKRLLLIRVDFSDSAGPPFSNDSGASLINSLNAFYTDMSYGQVGFALKGAGSEVTPTLRLPQAGAWYGTNNNPSRLRTDARDAAVAAGYLMSDFDLDVICFGTVPGFNWNGLANVGAPGAWLRGNFSLGVAAHELGHNFGLNHANFWETTGQSIIGPGTSVEYGDGFDTMGEGRSFGSQCHFNVRYKSYLNWLTTNDVSTVTTSGTYRIYAQDGPLATGVRALKIAAGFSLPFPPPTPGPFNYWVESRRQITGNKWLLDGAELRWGWNENQSTVLLDTTPGSSEGKSDSPLVIGRTFSDISAGIHITPIRKGGTAPAPEFLDVVVNLGSFTSNLAPTVTVTGNASNTQPGVPLNFEAAASDLDGDVLAYYWDFGDGNYGTNGPTASHGWSNVGDYVVRCRVTDMKGGNGSRSMLVTVGSPTSRQISGRITRAGGLPVENVQVFVSATQLSYTDSDGIYVLPGLPSGDYTVKARLDGFLISPSGFSNPIRLSTNHSNVDFLASTVLYPPTIITFPQNQTSRPGTAVTFNVVAVGTAPLSYQWKFNGTNIAGATNASYMQTVQMSDQGNYTLVVSNVAGTANATASLTVVTQAPPRIALQPQSQIVNAGSDAVFGVFVDNTSLGSRYQWFFNSTDSIAGATNNIVTITNVSDRTAGVYFVLITNNGGATTSSNAFLVINHLPVAQPDTLFRQRTDSVQVSISTLLSNDSDPDADSLSLLSFDTNSLQGMSVSLQNGLLTYVPLADFTNIDQFAYVVTDGRGGNAVGTVTVAVYAVPPPALTLMSFGDNEDIIQLKGVAGRTYHLEYSDNLGNSNWHSVGAGAANEFGVFAWTNTVPIGLTARFYRAVYP